MGSPLSVSKLPRLRGEARAPLVDSFATDAYDSRGGAPVILGHAAMKAIVIPARAKTLNDLFKKARRRSVLLEAPGGDHFVLASVEGWEAFEVGDDLTQNKSLMRRLAQRRSKGKPTSLEAVKARLGLR
jgi:hypothetical protein